MNDKEARAAAVELVAQLSKDLVVENAQDAIAWTLKCYDPEHGTWTLHGVFDDPARALIQADKWETQLNHDPNGYVDPYPFKVTVQPIQSFQDLR